MGRMKNERKEVSSWRRNEWEWTKSRRSTLGNRHRSWGTRGRSLRCTSFKPRYGSTADDTKLDQRRASRGPDAIQEIRGRLKSGIEMK